MQARIMMHRYAQQSFSPTLFLFVFCLFICRQEDDGIYITDLKRNTCRLLVSLKALVDRIPNKLIQKCNRRRSSSGSTYTYPPTYGFHTKWSSDGKMIMFVLRTLETLSGGIQKTVSQVDCILCICLVRASSQYLTNSLLYIV